VAAKSGAESGVLDFPGNPEHDGRVGIVPAGVHHAGMSRLVGHLIQLGDGQGVDVRPERDGRPFSGAADQSHGSGHARKGLHRDAGVGKDFDDFFGGLDFLVGGLRVRVEVPPHIHKPLRKSGMRLRHTGLGPPFLC
jgi:hypothetical protein